MMYRGSTDESWEVAGAAREAVEILELPANRQTIQELRIQGKCRARVQGKQGSVCLVRRVRWKIMWY